MRGNELQRGFVSNAAAGIDRKHLVHRFRIDHLDEDFTCVCVDGRRGVNLLVGRVAVQGGGHLEGAVAGHGEELLVPVVAAAPHAAVVEPDEVGVPFVEALLAEERGVGRHNHHIGIALQAGPVGRLGHGRFIRIVGVVVGELAHKNTRRLAAVVGVALVAPDLARRIAVTIGIEPIVVLVIVLVDDGVGVFRVDLRHVGVELAPGIAGTGGGDDGDVRILLLHRLVHDVEPLPELSPLVFIADA